MEVSDKANAPQDQGDGPTNAQLLPGLKPNELSKQSDDILDDDGRVIKGEDSDSKKGRAANGSSDDGSRDGGDQMKPDSDAQGKPDNGDLW